jgi:hypothetical protein
MNLIRGLGKVWKTNEQPQSLAIVCIMFLFFIFTDGMGYT